MASAGNSSFNWNAFAQGVGAGLSAYNPNQPLASMGAAVTASSRAVAGDQQQAQGLALRQQERDEAKSERDMTRLQVLFDRKDEKDSERSALLENREWLIEQRIAGEKRQEEATIKAEERADTRASKKAEQLRIEEKRLQGVARAVSLGTDTPEARAQKAAMQNQFGYFPAQFKGARTATGPSPTFEFTSDGAAQFLNITGAGGQSAFNLDPMNQRL